MLPWLQVINNQLEKYWNRSEGQRHSSGQRTVNHPPEPEDRPSPLQVSWRSEMSERANGFNSIQDNAAQKLTPSLSIIYKTQKKPPLSTKTDDD